MYTFFFFVLKEAVPYLMVGGGVVSRALDPEVLVEEHQIIKYYVNILIVFVHFTMSIIIQITVFI